MKRIADRIDYFSDTGVHTFRVKATWGEFLQDLSNAAFFVLMYVYALPDAWVFIVIVIVPFILIKQIGYSDYIFDTHQSVFSKRYGLGCYRLGETYRLDGLDRLRITVSPVLDFDGLTTADLEVNVENDDEKVSVYTSRGKAVIEVIRNQMKAISLRVCD